MSRHTAPVCHGRMKLDVKTRQYVCRCGNWTTRFVTKTVELIRGVR
ncbi:hypothetical protein [Streptomyces subrutilus]|nr:hypothetical protein [Streptomyces subrutilus]